MKFGRTTLLSAAGVILALGLTAAQAQPPESDASPSGPPAAATEAGGGGAGPGGGAPSAGPADRMDDGQSGAGAGATAPEGGPAEGPGKAAGQTDQMKPDSDQGAPDKGKATTKDTTPSDDKSAEKAGKAEGTAKTEGEAESKAEGRAGTAAEGKAGTTTEGKTGATAEDGAKVEGKAGEGVRLESQQVGKVKTYFSEHRPTVKAIDRTEVSVSIGVAIPGTIVLYDLPPDIIVVEGGCPIKYFVWGDDVVLVDSCSRHVVEIIVGVA
jgi:hypothetical protein